jgi:hypothetical protein
MTVRVGINGFGRIGRTVFRILAARSSVEVVGVNDLFGADQLAYLLQYDTVMGRYPGEVAAEADALRASGRRVVLTHGAIRQNRGAVEPRRRRIDRSFRKRRVKHLGGRRAGSGAAQGRVTR